MYTASRYNYYYPKEQSVIVYNTYTQSLAELEKECYPQLLNADESCRYAKEFKELGFWTDYDEQEEILRRHKEAVENKDELRVVVRLTDACNFRCPYCYQQHERIVMDEKKRNRVKQFIMRQKKEGQTVLVHYFGGEPLLNLDGILDLDAFLKENTESYYATLTTNGYLLNQDTVMKLKESKIESYQITLDGPPRIHNRTRILADGKGTFDVLIQNMRCLLENTSADLTIRFNVSRKNIEYAGELLEVLEQEHILAHSNVRLLFAQLHNYSEEDNGELFFKNEEYFHELLGVMKLMIQYKKKIPRYGPRYISCNMYARNTYVIGPNLELETCTSEETKVGVIDAEGNLISNEGIRKKERYYELSQQCMDCILLPMCMGGCSYKRSRRQNCCIMDLKDLNEYIDCIIKEKVEL